METIYRDYAPKGVKFYYLYKALAHPGLNNYVRPHTLEERVMHINEAKRTLGTEIPWLADNMANDLRHAIGNAPNSEFVLDPEGKIVRMRVWSDPQTLRADLEELVGKVERPTQISELNMKTAPPPEPAPTGIVPRVQRSGSYRPIIAEPQLEKSKHPFYVKLRAEADQDLLRNGAGKLYLGFFVDPIHHVHWNNQVAPVQYELAAKGVSFTPASGSGPEVAEDADADPREFVIGVERGSSTDPVNLKFHYYACSEKWCMPVTQEYLIRWEPDQDAGRAQGGGGRGGFGGGRGPGAQAGSRSSSRTTSMAMGVWSRTSCPNGCKSASTAWTPTPTATSTSLTCRPCAVAAALAAVDLAAAVLAGWRASSKPTRMATARSAARRRLDSFSNASIRWTPTATDSSNDARWLAEGREVAAGPAEPRSLDRGLEARTPVHASGSGQRAL